MVLRWFGRGGTFTAAQPSALSKAMTYDDNGYPELPACLDRRPEAEPLAEAA